MCPHRRTRKGGEENHSYCFDKPILGLEREPQMTKLCREYKYKWMLETQLYLCYIVFGRVGSFFIPDG
jgi:hypothetical protein